MAHAEGRGVPQDYKEALRWLRLVAEKGHASAQYSLGFYCLTGQGVPKDYVTAYAWMNLSASSGYTRAAEGRDKFTTLLTPAQIEAGQKLSRELHEEYGSK